MLHIALHQEAIIPEKPTYSDAKVDLHVQVLTGWPLHHETPQQPFIYWFHPGLREQMPEKLFYRGLQWSFFLRLEIWPMEHFSLYKKNEVNPHIVKWKSNQDRKLNGKRTSHIAVWKVWLVKNKLSKHAYAQICRGRIMENFGFLLYTFYIKNNRLTRAEFDASSPVHTRILPFFPGCWKTALLVSSLQVGPPRNVCTGWQEQTGSPASSSL